MTELVLVTEHGGIREGGEHLLVLALPGLEKLQVHATRVPRGARLA